MIIIWFLIRTSTKMTDNDYSTVYGVVVLFNSQLMVNFSSCNFITEQLCLTVKPCLSEILLTFCSLAQSWPCFTNPSMIASLEVFNSESTVHFPISNIARNQNSSLHINSKPGSPSENPWIVLSSVKRWTALMGLDNLSKLLAPSLAALTNPVTLLHHNYLV